MDSFKAFAVVFSFGREDHARCRSLNPCHQSEVDPEIRLVFRLWLSSSCLPCCGVVVSHTATINGAAGCRIFLSRFSTRSAVLNLRLSTHLIRGASAALVKAGSLMAGNIKWSGGWYYWTCMIWCSVVGDAGCCLACDAWLACRLGVAALRPGHASLNVARSHTQTVARTYLATWLGVPCAASCRSALRPCVTPDSVAGTWRVLGVDPENPD